MNPHLSPTAMFATVVSVGGGIIAQVTPSTNVGTAGLLASLSGLLLAGFQYFKAILDSRQQLKEIEQLKADLQGSRTRRHDEANRFNAALLRIQSQLEQEKLARARLEGKLGITANEHATAINDNADGIQQIAARLDPPVDVAPVHVAATPTTPESPSDPEIELPLKGQ